jgi:CRISPR-associated protein Cas2
MEDHLYLVTYDISDDKRLRDVYKLMKGYGEWLQFSVFQCRLSRKRRAEMIAKLDLAIHHDQDHILILDLGVAEKVTPRVVSLGKASFKTVQREPVIV